MNVSIEKVNGKKQTTYKVRAYKIIDGRRRIRTKSFKSLKQAEVYKNKIKKFNFTSIIKRNKTISEVIDEVINHPQVEEFGSKKRFSSLKRFKSYDLCLVEANDLDETHVMNYIVERKSEGIKPSTIASDLSDLSMLIKMANVLLSYTIKPEVVNNARSCGYTLKLVGKSEPRDRLPTEDEINSILINAYEQQSSNTNIPIGSIIEFALETALRVSEIAKLKWKDYDKKGGVMIVRSRKHPKYDRRCDYCIKLSQRAIDILNEMNFNGEHIFWNNSKTISGKFRNICNSLNINNLRFHDLRAEASVRMYKKGMNIVDIAKITGHRDINILINFYIRIGLIDKSIF